MTESRTETKDGINYELAKVMHDGKQVGFAPTRVFETDEEMLEHLGIEILCSLAIRQYRQDAKNAVRAKFNKGKVTPAAAMKFMESNPDKVAEISRVCVVEKISLVEACEKSMGVGENAKPDAEKIHWDI